MERKSDQVLLFSSTLIMLLCAIRFLTNDFQQERKGFSGSVIFLMIQII